MAEEGKDIEVLEYALKKKPIVIAITRETNLEEAARTSASVAFLLNSDILTLQTTVNQLHDAGKLTFVHLDLMTGVARDASGIKYLAEHIGVDGIVTTRSNLISIAKQHELLTVQRTFLLDSVSVDQTVKTMHDSRPDAVEVLPGLVIPHVIQRLQSSRNTPIIAGGLLSTIDHARAVMNSGVIGISTSSVHLWRWQDNAFPNDESSQSVDE